MTPETPAVWLASPVARHYFDPARLSPRDAERQTALQHPSRGEEFMVSRSLQQYLAIPPETPQSLSHSGRYAAVAFSPNPVRVGVDIEHHRPRDIQAIAQFAFSEVEAAALAPLDGPALQRAFYTRWVMKEATAKALHLPLLEATRTCVFREVGNNWRGTLPCALPWQVYAYEPIAGLSLAVALIDIAGSDSLRTCEWPPTRPADWPLVAKIFSASDSADTGGLPEESSTCRELLPTS